jgi:multidrug efflux pump subunit AcrB
MEAALTGSREIGFTVMSISVSLVAVFIPLLLMGGIIGRLFREFSITVTAAIGVSAFVSLALTPMLCARFLSHKPIAHGRVYNAIEAVFDGMLDFYRRTLDAVLRHQFPTLIVFLATMAASIYLFVIIPKGFFPIQDTGLVTGFAESAQDISPQEMSHIMVELGAVVGADPDVAAFGSAMGSTGSAQTANTGRFFIALKPRDQRKATATDIINRLRPKLAKVEGVSLVLQPSQDITVGGRIGRGQFLARCQSCRAERLGAEDPWPRCELCPSSPTLRPISRLDAPARHQDQSRSGGALRHLAPRDRRDPERRLRPTSGGGILHPDQHLQRRPGGAACHAGKGRHARQHLRQGTR